MSHQEHYAFRAELVQELVRDFLGPSAHEVPRPDEDPLREDPITRYRSGVLYPQSSGTISPEDDVDGEVDVRAGGCDDTEEAAVALANVRYPSAMGLSFAVDEDVTTLRVDISAVRFTAVDQPGGWPSGARSTRALWRRDPLILPPTSLPVEASTGRKAVTDGLDLYWRIRSPQNGTRSITVGLINTHRVGPGAHQRDGLSWFHPTLEVRTEPIQHGFVARPDDRANGIDDEDLDSYRLLYRHALEFASGHGCAADWDLSDTPDRAERVFATFAPTYDLRLADSNPNIASPWFSLHALSDHGGRDQIVAGLLAFANEYAAWIQCRRGDAERLDQSLQAVASRHLDHCAESAGRIKAGIDLLRSDDDTWRAFVIMNRAMLMQRVRTDWFKTDRSSAPDDMSPQVWRPFQLAFILQALPGIANPQSEDRDIVDLLWFPTGGGKTEAYLGLIAFTIAHRRLQKRGAGVTALMRYTLRLLTIQQFERASTLICALELLRREDPKALGEQPISIGLWVGGDATPLTRRDARQALDKIRAGIDMDKGSPIQLHRCSWCGQPLDYKNYWVAEKDPRLVIACRSERCELRDGLPAWIIDEDIYQRRPSLLIATADKFASLPWRDSVKAIFNLGSNEPPPELIVQDELHLISGPLGTLAGLYETAIDALCTRNGTRPKVVASTATIRRARKQVKALFARDVRQFPAPGIDARDNWFSVEASPAERASRLYVGLMAPGTSQTTLLVRAYAALLQNAQNIGGREDVRDAYMTLLGYFNSLRVLGGARMQVNDDVPDRIDVLAGRCGGTPRAVDRVIELTSRESSSAIPGHLRDMARAYPDKSRLDVILATNMISVGVDIDRLSLMALMGQPQSASEYIQATSRVGRRYPGLVVVLFNAARSRDRSHYESFRTFHSALYRQVDSSSVTPFSPRALDRALHAVLVGLARQTLPAFQGNTGAASITSHRDELEKVFNSIRDRVKAVAPDSLKAVDSALTRIADEWAAAAADGSLVYANKFNSLISLLVDAADHKSDPEGHFRTLWSLRDVDTESNMFLVRD